MPNLYSLFFRHRLSILWIGLLSALVLGEAWSVRQSKSITFDETYYLSCGLQTVHDRWIDPRIAAEGIAPLPIMLTYVPALAGGPVEARPEPWKGQLHDRDFISGPRLFNTLVMGLPLIVLVFVWLFRRRDLATACLGSGLLALSPTFMRMPLWPLWMPRSHSFPRSRLRPRDGTFRGPADTDSACGRCRSRRR